MAEDYYRILGVNRDASSADIQKAYRKLARKYHPDLHPDDKAATKKFQEVQKAFDVLNDPSKREMYDRYGDSFESMGRAGAGAGPGGGFRAGGAGHPGQAGPEGFDFSSFFGDRDAAESGTFADIFSHFRRGGGRSPRQPQAGADVHAEVEIPFTTAVLGGATQIMLQRQDGTSATIEVKIPAGIADGKKIRLRNQGEQPPDAPPGDLLITVRVQPHPFFQRRGDHLDVKTPVTLAEAALGAKIDVPTPKGVISLRVPPGTSSGVKLRVKGHGVPTKNGPPGDLFAEIQIVLPKPLDDESLELIKQFDARNRSNQPDPRADLHW